MSSAITNCSPPHMKERSRNNRSILRVSRSSSTAWKTTDRALWSLDQTQNKRSGIRSSGTIDDWFDPNRAGRCTRPSCYTATCSDSQRQGRECAAARYHGRKISLQVE
eukprot:767419-Hanusia_phi.AAC.8